MRSLETNCHGLETNCAIYSLRAEGPVVQMVGLQFTTSQLQLYLIDLPIVGRTEFYPPALKFYPPTTYLEITQLQLQLLLKYSK